MLSRLSGLAPPGAHSSVPHARSRSGQRDLGYLLQVHYRTSRRCFILKLVFICIDSEQSIGIDAACMGASDDHRPRKDDNTQGTSLEELHILSCTSSRGVVHSVADTVVMLRIFRGIGRLVWEMRAWIHYLDPDDITHPERPLFLVQVESIKLTMNHWWQWEDATLALPRVIQPCCLTSLSVRSILSWSDACATGTLLRAVGRNLKSLTLGIYIPTTYLSGRVSEIVTGISAQGLSQLETLRCTLSMEGPLDAGSQRLSILTALISTAPPSLRTVQITLQVHDDGCPVQLAVPAANWTQLDKIMSAHAGLQAVNVVLRCIESEHPPQTTGPGPEEVVKGELRATSAKGIVTVAIEVDRQY
ncbi:hypothetical protein C8Q80DRAFT_226386 [Daedaleopsis nitida]|nr:hypothetical protein C8Q80DRAFT_226386 [Daedaleopsis nitida]